MLTTSETLSTQNNQPKPLSLLRGFKFSAIFQNRLGQRSRDSNLITSGVYPSGNNANLSSDLPCSTSSDNVDFYQNVFFDTEFSPSIQKNRRYPEPRSVKRLILKRFSAAKSAIRKFSHSSLYSFECQSKAALIGFDRLSHSQTSIPPITMPPTPEIMTDMMQSEDSILEIGTQMDYESEITGLDSMINISNRTRRSLSFEVDQPSIKHPVIDISLSWDPQIGYYNLFVFNFNFV